MSDAPGAWHQQNQRQITAALAALRAWLEQRLEARSDAKAVEGGPPRLGLPPEAPSPGFVSRLDQVTQAFRLSPFERSVLLLCAGVELEASFSSLLAKAQGDARRTLPTFGLALSLLPDAHWSALGPSAPLRRWRLVVLGEGESLVQSPLRIDERVLHHLVGLTERELLLEGVIEPVEGDSEVVPSQQPLVERLAETWSTPSPAVPVMCGGDRIQRRSIAMEAARRQGMAIHRLRPTSLPTSAQDVTSLQRLWEREALLLDSVLVLEWPEGEVPELQRAAAGLVDMLRCPLVISATEAPPLPGRASIHLPVSSPRAEESLLLWRRHLGEAATGLEGPLNAITSQFHLGPLSIRSACGEALATTGATLPLDRALWVACRTQSRPRLDDLAQRIDGSASWEDLVLPAPQLQLLRELATQVRHRARVHDAWGFAERSSRGLGLSALFSGPSGTGKTMAAEVLAAELSLDLYRIDLSQVVSKYIGETEKNLRRIFDAADEAGVILLFDEADALFGKRSEVRDSHDRYANLEVSYLLQRMEAYRGLAILTTNFKSALDVAFMRRLRFVVQFPFPDAEQRQELWRRAFPKRTPLSALDYPRLARVNMAGGNIRNIALNAAFIAASEERAVGMGHLLRATRMEYAKLEKPLTDAEVAGWT
ncbi:ATP-binding protein [Corallococcus exercitus]|uniref:ATP-binding protein n=1 Tax=Corallococcus exercitus TaxID=2316736 RepID=A0A7Y4KIY0_9BACT|nr:ATP-binding protein [Corallococcus exercitus]NOK34663.1 ATP-binding protein [Corallococcus exercitus]